MLSRSMLSRSYDQSLTNKKLRSSTSAATSIKKVDDNFTTKNDKILPSGDLTHTKSHFSKGSKSIYTEKEESLLKMLLDCKDPGANNTELKMISTSLSKLG